MPSPRIVDIHAYLPVLMELVEQGESVTLTITGGSMTPFLQPGQNGQGFLRHPVPKGVEGSQGDVLGSTVIIAAAADQQAVLLRLVQQEGHLLPGVPGIAALQPLNPQAQQHRQLGVEPLPGQVGLPLPAQGMGPDRNPPGPQNAADGDGPVNAGVPALAAVNIPGDGLLPGVRQTPVQNQLGQVWLARAVQPSQPPELLLRKPDAVDLLQMVQPPVQLGLPQDPPGLQGLVDGGGLRPVAIAQNVALPRAGDAGELHPADEAKRRRHQGLHLAAPVDGVVVGEGKGPDARFLNVLHQLGRVIRAVGGGAVHV